MEPVDVTPFHSIEIPVLETWGVLMRRDDPLAEKTAVTPDALRQTPGHSLILQKRETLQGFFENWYGPIDPGQVVAWHDMLANAAHMVHRGLGRVVTLKPPPNNLWMTPCVSAAVPRLTYQIHAGVEKRGSP